jgi:hypothetical protein
MIGDHIFVRRYAIFALYSNDGVAAGKKGMQFLVVLLKSASSGRHGFDRVVRFLEQGKRDYFNKKTNVSPAPNQKTAVDQPDYTPETVLL